MKHNKLSAFVKKTFKQIITHKKSSVSLKNFHPSFILKLSKYSDSKFIFYFKSGSLDSFSYLFSELVGAGKVLVFPLSKKLSSPEGFWEKKEKNLFASVSSLVSNSKYNFILAEAGIENVRFENLSSSSSVLRISPNSKREDVVSWLKKNNYKKTSLVSSEGEFAERGGIVDVFSYSLGTPLRINFFDFPASLSFFDLETQLTTKKTNSYLLNSIIKGNNSFLFSDIIKQRFFPVYINGNVATFYKKTSKNIIDLPIKYYPLNSFLQHKKNNDVVVDSSLSLFSFLYKDVFFAPISFLENNSSKKTSALSVENLSVGDFFVHNKFGIGSFCGLKTSLDGTTEQLVLKYKNNEFVNISVENMDSIGFFAPKYEKGVSLDSISGKGSWSKKVSRVKKEMESVVDSILLSIDEKKHLFRVPYNINLKDLDSFLKTFPFKPTADQESSWGDILKDLTSNKPMNRLLCGDVGFGKTEVAMRAAFVVSFTKQVVIMAPTTVLSLQLYNSFKNRFKNFPQNISLINRLVSGVNKNKIYNNIKTGKIDIIIGTHSLLSEKIYFYSLGLVVVDEEHRFGAKQKEKISSISMDADLLSMSATPIPRSLQQSFYGLRNLSLIKTPPLERRPIITSVVFSSKSTIFNYISAEMFRKGQVYVVYNNVNNIEGYIKKIQNLFPSLSVECLHGKLSPKTIEKTLSLFINKKIDVLVCSTIIEAGLDVPNTNTILIENSQNLGLAQLYQLRGRVGRSSEQAFAVLMVPKNKKIASVSYQRLKTIQKNNSLGSGFDIAKKDLQIRGGGSIFGYSQSGSFSYIGRELYSQILNETIQSRSVAVSSLKISLKSIVVHIYEKTQIEESFVSNQYLRFDLYKKIFSCSDEISLNKIKNEVKDRFGVVSNGLFCLFNTQIIRILCSSLGIKNIVLKSGCFLQVVFSNKVENLDSLLSVSSAYFNSIGCDFKFNNSIKNSLVLQIQIKGDLNVFSLLYKYLNKLLK